MITLQHQSIEEEQQLDPRPLKSNQHQPHNLLPTHPEEEVREEDEGAGGLVVLAALTT